jgi:hypothetical protein
MTVPQAPAVNSAAVAPAAPEIRDTRPVDDRIGDLAKGFLADLDANPDPDEARRQEAQQAPQEPVETEAPELEAETPTQPEIPLVEIDIDGEKYQIPEKVKHRVMADKDYRQKTMELSATRKQMEQLTATAAQLAQQAQQMAPHHARLYSLDNYAQGLNQQLQSPELRADPIEYNRVLGELNLALHQRTQIANGLQQQQSHFQAQERQLRAQQLALDVPKLFEQFPDLQKPEARQKLSEYIQNEGLPQEAIAYLNWSAAGTKLAWKAHQYDQMVADQQKSAKKLQEKVKTLPPANPSSRAVEPSANDKQARNQWQKRGGKLHDPNFDAYLRAKLRSK